MKRFIGPSPRAGKEVNGERLSTRFTLGWLRLFPALYGSFVPSVEGQALGGQSVTSLFVSPLLVRVSELLLQ